MYRWGESSLHCSRLKSKADWYFCFTWCLSVLSHTVANRNFILARLYADTCLLQRRLLSTGQAWPHASTYMLWLSFSLSWLQLDLAWHNVWSSRHSCLSSQCSTGARLSPFEDILSRAHWLQQNRVITADSKLILYLSSNTREGLQHLLRRETSCPTPFKCLRETVTILSMPAILTWDSNLQSVYKVSRRFQSCHRTEIKEIKCAWLWISHLHWF